ncbi:MAG TPA: prepilin-type N-terminal cleavage/methylation domain-containing protein [Phycisphaerae bacterium]|jgi:prepilin-type N-terminal cleavage/methylation domain-containing protein
MSYTHRKNAFSLVELVIVIVIIGVIAAIAVPRISRGARGAADSSVRGSLASLRNAIDLYAAEHNGVFPAAAGDGTNAASTMACLVNQLTKFTDANGAYSDTKSATAIYGPYLRQGMPGVPVGPNKGGAKAKEVKIGNTGPVVSEATGEGWVYNTVTGDMIANTDDLDESGVAYNTY